MPCVIDAAHLIRVSDFKYGDDDSVLLVRLGDYERCRAASPLRRFADGGGGTRFAFARPGLFYFISGVTGHCERGQRMTVRVLGQGAPPPSPLAPPAPPSPPSPSAAAPGTSALAGVVAAAAMALPVIMLTV